MDKMNTKLSSQFVNNIPKRKSPLLTFIPDGSRCKIGLPVIAISQSRLAEKLLCRTNRIMNHFKYADDIVLFSPSSVSMLALIFIILQVYFICPMKYEFATRKVQ